MKKHRTTFLMVALALACMSTQGMYAMQAPQHNLYITVRYHHPSGVSAHYFEMPSTGTVGDLQKAISQKLNIDQNDLKLIVSKSYIEVDPFNQDENTIAEISMVVIDPARSLGNDSVFGILRGAASYTPASYDIVSLSDFQYSDALKCEFARVLKQQIVISRIKMKHMWNQMELTIKQCSAEKKNDNDFKDF